MDDLNVSQADEVSQYPGGEGTEDGDQGDAIRYRLLVAAIRRAASIFPARSLSASLAHYQSG